MWVLSSLVYSLCEVVLRPFRTSSPWLPLLLLGVATGLVLLLIFRLLSDQTRIKRLKDAIKAHILEMWLFRNDPRILLSAQGRILLLNGRYLGLMVRPMLVLIVPLVLVLLALEGWFGYRPLRPGETALVEAEVAKGSDRFLRAAALEAGPGLKVETEPLRIAPSREVDWRIRATQAGAHTLRLRLNGQQVDKAVTVSQHFVPVAPVRQRASFWGGLLTPGEAPFPRTIPATQVAVRYPERVMRLWGWKIHWLVSFFVISVTSGLILKGFVGVEF